MFGYWRIEMDMFCFHVLDTGTQAAKDYVIECLQAFTIQSVSHSDVKITYIPPMNREHINRP